METKCNVLEILSIQNKKQLCERREQAIAFQKDRKKKRNALIDLLKAVLQNTAVPHYLCNHIVSFVRFGFDKSVPQPNPMKIISSHYSASNMSSKTRVHRQVGGGGGPLLDALIGPYWSRDADRQRFNAFIDTFYHTIDEKVERLYPPGLRDHLSGMKVSQLRELARTVPGARTTGNKNTLINNLLHYISFTTVWR